MSKNDNDIFNDINYSIVKFFHFYNHKNKTKFKITQNSLIRLKKFISIFIKTVFITACLVSLKDKNFNIYNITCRLNIYISEILIKGCNVDIFKIRQDYDYLTNPLNIEPSILTDKSDLTDTDYIHNTRFNNTLRIIFDNIIYKYGEHHFKDKYDEHDNHFLSKVILKLLLCVIKICSKSNTTIIDNEILNKVADLEDIIKLDNALGGNQILKTDFPDIEKETFQEILIDDLVDDDDNNNNDDDDEIDEIFNVVLMN